MKAIAAIDKLKELRAGWDSYEADPIELTARESAKRFLHRVQETAGPEYANPSVGPTPDGGVALVWRRPGGPKVEVRFSRSGGEYVVFRERKLLERGRIDRPDFVVNHVLKRFIIS